MGLIDPSLIQYWDQDQGQDWDWRWVLPIKLPRSPSSSSSPSTSSLMLPQGSSSFSTTNLFVSGFSLIYVEDTDTWMELNCGVKLLDGDISSPIGKLVAQYLEILRTAWEAAGNGSMHLCELLWTKETWTKFTSCKWSILQHMHPNSELNRKWRPNKCKPQLQHKQQQDYPVSQSEKIIPSSN